MHYWHCSLALAWISFGCMLTRHSNRILSILEPVVSRCRPWTHSTSLLLRPTSGLGAQQSAVRKCRMSSAAMRAALRARALAPSAQTASLKHQPSPTLPHVRPAYPVTHYACISKLYLRLAPFRTSSMGPLGQIS